MSANNKITIFKEDMEWQVEERDADTNGVITDLGGWADLESAIACANDFMKTEEVEYGLDIRPTLVDTKKLLPNPEDDGPNAEGNKVPAPTEEEWDVSPDINVDGFDYVRVETAKHLRKKAFDAGYEEGQEAGRTDVSDKLDSNEKSFDAGYAKALEDVENEIPKSGDDMYENSPSDRQVGYLIVADLLAQLRNTKK